MKVYVGERDQALDLNPNDQVSRQRWAYVTGAVLCHAYTPEGLHTVVMAGEDEFVRVAKVQLHGHGFHREDLVNIFRMMKRRSDSLARQGRVTA